MKYRVTVAYDGEADSMEEISKNARLVLERGYGAEGLAYHNTYDFKPPRITKIVHLERPERGDL